MRACGFAFVDVWLVWLLGRFGGGCCLAIFGYSCWWWFDLPVTCWFGLDLLCLVALFLCVDVPCVCLVYCFLFCLLIFGLVIV